MPADLEVNELKVNGSLTFGDVCKMYLTKGTSGINDRLGIKSLKGSMEIEIEPAEDFNTNSRIISQIQILGKVEGVGADRWRRRADLTIFNDSAGGEALYIGSTNTSNAPSGSIPMPMVFRVQSNTNEQPDFDVVFHPGDSTIEMKDYKKGIFIRKPLDEWMKDKDFDDL